MDARKQNPTTALPFYLHVAPSWVLFLGHKCLTEGQVRCYFYCAVYIKKKCRSCSFSPPPNFHLETTGPGKGCLTFPSVTFLESHFPCLVLYFVKIPDSFANHTIKLTCSLALRLEGRCFQSILPKNSSGAWCVFCHTHWIPCDRTGYIPKKKLWSTATPVKHNNYMKMFNAFHTPHIFLLILYVAKESGVTFSFLQLENIPAPLPLRSATTGNHFTIPSWSKFA